MKAANGSLVIYCAFVGGIENSNMLDVIRESIRFLYYKDIFPPSDTKYQNRIASLRKWGRKNIPSKFTTNGIKKRVGGFATPLHIKRTDTPPQKSSACKIVEEAQSVLQEAILTCRGVCG